MEARRITVVSTRNQTKKVIMSSAETLAELKADLRQNDIDYSGMTFYEGLSKTELKDDASVLPHDVPFRGQTTNELVFMLTNTNKKIRSGAMTRAEAYAEIKTRGLQEECVRRFGKNFTMCKTADLLSLLDSAPSSKPAPEKAPAEKPVEEKAPKESVQKETPASEEVMAADPAARTALAMLVSTLVEKEVIDECDADEIREVLKDPSALPQASSKAQDKTSEVPYSESELDDMFSFVR